jgi:hypothetical protein
MADAKRFEGLKKLPARPAAEVLASAGVKPFTAGSMAPGQGIPEALAALEAKGLVLDAVRLLAQALPKREAIWWACLAARDLGPEAAGWATLKAAEEWVFHPGTAAREAAIAAAAAADQDEPSLDLARAARFADPGDDDGAAAHPGLVGILVEGMLIRSLFAQGGPGSPHARLLIDRALDIARGGSGRIARDSARPGNVV